MHYLIPIIVLAGCNDPGRDKGPAHDTAWAEPTNGTLNCVITGPENGEESDVGETVTLNATVSDPEGSADTLTVTWASDKDGRIGSSTPDTDGLVTLETQDLSADVHTISLGVDDASNGSCTDSIVHTVVERPPEISTVTLGPDPARVRDTLICDYTGFQSPMGGEDRSTIGWMVNSITLDTIGRVLSGGFSGDDTVTCIVTPNDGLATGTPQSDSVLIQSIPRYDATPAWPLCGRIAEDPPPGWNETHGCPSDRWNNTAFTDYPINSTFGPRQLWSDDYRYDYHRGIDLSADIGTPIFAVAPGEVLKAGNDPSYSDPVVQIRHTRPDSDGSCVDQGCWHTNYLHLSSWSVNPGDTVERGALLGHTGASASGYAHLHFEVRDARAADPYSAWQRDTIHPLSVLPYPDGTSGPELTIESVDTRRWTEPTANILVAFRTPMPELDLIRVEIRVFAGNESGDFIEVPQRHDTPWFVGPSFFDVDIWNLQYTHKNSTDFSWTSFSDCPYVDDHAATYDPHIHMDQRDAVDPSVGLFNGVRIAPNFYNESTEQWLLELSFMGLITPVDASSLRFIAELTDAAGNVMTSVPVDVSAP
jgi:murein DD-endopeptidase MepM/ murein hydrolase activator NlpD